MRGISVCLALGLVPMAGLAGSDVEEAVDPEPCVASAIDAMQRRYDGLRDMRASFVQTMRISDCCALPSQVPVLASSRPLVGNTVSSAYT